MNNNHRLEYIHPGAFAFPEKDNPKILQYPQITKLFLQNNNLTSLDQNIVFRIDELKEVELHGNPWTCDCNVQWIVDHIMPKMNQTAPGSAGRVM
jgi:hypothetical protein